MRLLIAIAAAALSMPVAAQQAALAAAPQAPARVSVPFNPPLERPLRYRVTTTKQRDGRPVSVWIDYELRFTRHPEGFRLAVQTTDAGSPDMSDAPPGMVRQTVAGLSLPYVLLLDTQGAIEGMEDQEAYWNRMMTLTEQAIRRNVGIHGPVDDTALAQMMRAMRETSPQAQLTAATENIAPILQFGGGDFTVGENRTGEEEVEGLMGIRVRQQSRLLAERIENGRLRVTLRSTIPQDDMRRAIEGFITRIPVTGQGRNTQAERERGMAELRAARFDRQSEYNYQVSLDSGLVHSGGGTERTIFEMGGQRRDQTETFRIERMD